MFDFKFKLGILVVLSAWFFVHIHSEGVGSVCYVKEDCGLWHFVCDNDICKCDNEHIPDRDNKWCAVDIEAACGYHDTCYDPNADCVGVAWPKYGSCQCNKNYTLHPIKRVCSAVIGHNCTTTEDCIEGTCKLALPCEKGACNYTQCFCNEPLQANIHRTKCLPALNDTCQGYDECARENSICNDKKICECAKNYKEAKRRNETGTETYCLAMLNNTCINATDCADNGTACVEKNETEINNRFSHNKYRQYSWPPPKDPPKKYCVCGEGYVQQPDVSTCLKVATQLNDTCVHDIQCKTYSGIGSECKNNKCACKESFYFDEDFNRCVRSCLCNRNEEIIEIKQILKELVPAFKIMGNKNNIDLSKVMRKINNL